MSEYTKFEEVKRVFLNNEYKASIHAASYGVSASDYTDANFISDDEGPGYANMYVDIGRGEEGSRLNDVETITTLRDLLTEALGHFTKAKMIADDINAAWKAKKAAEDQTAEFV